MSEDDSTILFCLVLSWFFLLLLISRAESKLKVGLIHVSIQVVYSLYFLYNLQYNSEGGGSLVHWAFWIFTIGIQLLVILIHLIITLFKPNK